MKCQSIMVVIPPGMSDYDECYGEVVSTLPPARVSTAYGTTRTMRTAYPATLISGTARATCGMGNYAALPTPTEARNT